MAGAYLNCVDVRDSLASPLYALDDESASLPTLLIQVGIRELLLGDSRRFATRAKASGAHVDYVERLQVVYLRTRRSVFVLDLRRRGPSGWTGVQLS
jgi:acetyl esterase/lipase